MVPQILKMMHVAAKHRSKGGFCWVGKSNWKLEQCCGSFWLHVWQGSTEQPNRSEQYGKARNYAAAEHGTVGRAGRAGATELTQARNHWNHNLPQSLVRCIDRIDLPSRFVWRWRDLQKPPVEWKCWGSDRSCHGLSLYGHRLPGQLSRTQWSSLLQWRCQLSGVHRDMLHRRVALHRPWCRVLQWSGLSQSRGHSFGSRNAAPQWHLQRWGELWPGSSDYTEYMMLQCCIWHYMTIYVPVQES